MIISFGHETFLHIEPKVFDLMGIINDLSSGKIKGGAGNIDLLNAIGKMSNGDEEQLGFRAACKAKHETAVARNRRSSYGDSVGIFGGKRCVQ